MIIQLKIHEFQKAHFKNTDNSVCFKEPIEYIFYHKVLSLYIPVIFNKFQEKFLLHIEASLFWSKNRGNAKKFFSAQEFLAIFGRLFRYGQLE
jgi:hypothetical protein